MEDYKVLLQEVKDLVKDPFPDGIKGVTGIPTGFKALDMCTSGWKYGEIITITGDAGIGKTTLATTMATRMAVVIFIDLILTKHRPTKLSAMFPNSIIT